MNNQSQNNLIPIISLTTDFGQQDGYVGAMQGVILSTCPRAVITTLSHDIPAQDVQAAAFVLYQACGYYPPHAVHCVVVDPGVGSERRAVAVATAHGTFVGPDNGVFSLVLAAGQAEVIAAVSLTNPAYQRPAVSATFHGRDIFAPAAAHLAAGVPLAELGPPVNDLVQLEFIAKIRQEDSQDISRVIHIDRFGNILLDLTAADIIDPQRIRFKVGDKHIESLSYTFADVAEGEVLAYVGSTRDHVAIALRNGNAARTLGIELGDAVEISYGKKTL